MIQVMVHVLRFLGRFLGGICSLKMKQGGVGLPAGGAYVRLAPGGRAAAGPCRVYIYPL